MTLPGGVFNGTMIPYEPASLDNTQPGYSLTRRANETDARVPVPASDWKFTTCDTGTNAFPGLIDLYDATNKFVDAGGTTASTGSSAWFVKFGDMEDGMVSMVFGNDQLFASREWILQQLAVDGGTGVTDVMTNLLAAAVGVALADQDAVVRIGKLTEDSGKGLTDSLGYRALEKFPVGYTPDVCLMTKRSQRQLRDSRTNTNGGAPNAPLPTDIAGIPIVLTDSILNTEALSL